MSLPPPWDPEQDDTLLCVATRQETHDVRTFVFRPDQPRLLQFLPGQFMTFELDAIGQQRCYTIASPPTRPYRIEITTKRSGPASSWLHDQLRPGMRLRVSGPAGDFSFGGDPRGKFLFLAAGSGITPLMSMARAAHDLGSEADIVLVQSARSEADLLFSGELRSMMARPGFRTVSIVEHDVPGASWDGFRGRISEPILAALAPDLLDREVFCCGPAPYMASVRTLLAAAGFDMRRYREESFTFAAAEPEPDAKARPYRTAPLLPLPLAGEGRGEGERGQTRAPVCWTDHPHPDPLPPAGEGASVGDTFKVLFSRSGRTITCASGTTVIAAARAAGLRLPSACQKGVCGTCKSHLAEGTVEMNHGGGIRQREIDAGMVLLCCSTPTSDLVVDR